MKRIHRTLSQDIWKVEDKFVIVPTNRRPYKKYNNNGCDTLESAVKLCNLLDQIDENDPMAIFDKFTVEAA